MLFIVPLHAQQAQSIKGFIRDSAVFLSGATITIKKTHTNEILKTGLSEAGGFFEISFYTNDSITLEVSYAGYANYEKQVVFGNEPFSFNAGEIIMQEAPVEMSNVTVNARKPFIVSLIDRVVVNPEAMISNAGLNGLELMERCPGVMVDMNGNLSLRGKNGVMVYIDDKPSYLTGAELAAYLRSIPSSSIASIELLTNPPAKYDAAGNAGIIIIRLKKSITKGWSGGISLSFGQGRFSRSNNSANLQYRVGKFNIFGSLSANYNQSYQDLTIERYYFDTDGKPISSFVQHSFFTPIGRNANLRTGMDFYMNDRITLGLTTGGLLTHSERMLDNTATVTDGSQVITSYVDATNPTDIQFNNYFINGNALWKTSGSSEITLNLDYMKYDNRIEQLLTNKIFSPQRDLLFTSVLESDLPTELAIHSLKLDYLKTLKKGRIESGLKSSIVSADNQALFYDVTGGEKNVNNEFTNRFLYDENIHAAYINYSREMQQLSLQLGLRAEYTNIKGYQTGIDVVKDSAFQYSYTSLFPTVFAQYTFDTTGTNVIGLSAGRRIDRPVYKDLNPFSYPMDRFTYYGGNPFLVPTFSYTIDLSYTYKNKITTTLTYSWSNDVIFETNEQRGTIYYSRPGNFARQVTYGLTINSSQQITPWWSCNLYLSWMRNAFESPIYTEFLNDAKWYAVISPVNQFTINKKWSAELSASYQSALLMGQFIIQPIYSVRIGLATKILKDKGSLKFNISDVFYTNQVEGDIRNIANANANWFSFLDSRVATLAFAWRFSKGQQYKLRQTGGAEAEQKRVKS